MDFYEVLTEVRKTATDADRLPKELINDFQHCFGILNTLDDASDELIALIDFIERVINAWNEELPTEVQADMYYQQLYERSHSILYPLEFDSVTRMAVERFEAETNFNFSMDSSQFKSDPRKWFGMADHRDKFEFLISDSYWSDRWTFFLMNSLVEFITK